MTHKKIYSKKHLSLEVTKGRAIHVNVMDSNSGRKGNYLLQHTQHSIIRSEQRGIDNTVIMLVVEFGKVFHKQGLEYYVLGSKKLPDVINNEFHKKAQNTVVVLGEGGQVVTCYKGNHVMRHIQRKQKFLAAA